MGRLPSLSVGSAQSQQVGSYNNAAHRPYLLHTHSCTHVAASLSPQHSRKSREQAQLMGGEIKAPDFHLSRK